MKFRLATWNINSVRLRLPLIERFVAAAQPDILCLQEIKCAEDLFPLAAVQQLGFPHVAVSGQKGYNGVAILSKLPLGTSEKRDICGRGHARHVSVTLEASGGPVSLHNLYIPAGGDIPDPAVNEKFQHKLDFLDAMEAWFKEIPDRDQNRMIIVGDLNIAPLETDVWSHKQLLKVVSHTPIEVERLNRVIAAHDFIDVMREHVPAEEALFTWWSYRNRDWRVSNRGRRLDHIWTTPALAGTSRSMSVLEDARDWEKPSDHVPVIAEFEID
ncbi:exodeoxyribonuclease III [Methyloligella sp. 2.7D]|uniref:exodeoxyribonuclease III n=1 Tax=unclassified Methyloligella TaxID=2625955 RepID=UPI00157D24BE|nr:exodeoxyribonuclease III [Methyloligella sp. GL2]QKP76257.1 exodeoxyribonuclease III [Methyloligella sp. GL2]